MTIYWIVDPITRDRLIADSGGDNVATITWDWELERFVVKATLYSGIYKTLDEAKAFVEAQEG